MNSSRNTAKKIVVLDFYINPATVRYKGKEIKVEDYELYTMMIADWRKRYSWTQKQALEEFFFGFE